MGMSTFSMNCFLDPLAPNLFLPLPITVLDQEGEADQDEAHAARVVRMVFMAVRVDPLAIRQPFRAYIYRHGRSRFPR